MDDLRKRIVTLLYYSSIEIILFPEVFCHSYPLIRSHILFSVANHL